MNYERSYQILVKENIQGVPKKNIGFRNVLLFSLRGVLASK